MQKQFQLIFNGFSSEEDEVIRSVKAALLTELELTSEEIKSVFEKMPVGILDAESEEELFPYFELLIRSGADVCIANKQPEILNTEEAETEFEFELDFVEEPKKNKKKNNKVYNLLEEPTITSDTMDNETFAEVSELMDQLKDSSYVLKPTHKPHDVLIKKTVEEETLELKPDRADENYDLLPLAEEEPVSETKKVIKESEQIKNSIEEKPKALPKRIKLSLPTLKNKKLTKSSENLSMATVFAVIAAMLVIFVTAIPIFKIQTFDEPARILAEKMAREFAAEDSAMPEFLPKELLGEAENNGFKFTARLYQENDNLYSIRLAVTGEEPKQLSKLEILRGAKAIPWLKQLRVSEQELSIAEDGSFDSKLKGEALLDLAGESYQIAIESLVNGRLIAGGAKARVWARFLYGINEFEISDEQKLIAKDDGEFVLSVSTQINLVNQDKE